MLHLLQTTFLKKTSLEWGYDGNLLGLQEVDVKRLLRRTHRGLNEFKNEISLIAKLQRMNLQAQIDWRKHFEIIEGISRLVFYLNRDHRIRKIPRDLKSSNILLVGDMIPQISEFGISIIFGGSQNEAYTTLVVGTYYMSPKYAMENLFSVKAVYSFAVELLEIGNLLGLQEVAVKILSRRTDQGLEEVKSEISLIANMVLCVQDSPISRLTMPSMVLMMESETYTSSSPKSHI
ncbi:PREDICTED: G-type lectin S-receptor [Prunus dulcis]|uniref:non-specific serine/threonine protein kinase n=1 Tax=Prunus dulcis TaxID=3755 RepID=A0A5E4FLZ7_PRUDU|nr:PREDICTED: G-type lectin S-receptor [Prunus dulcis]